MEFRRKKIRLPAANYFGQRHYFITFCCHQHLSVFRDAKLAEWLVQDLKSHSAEGGFWVHAYCVMPDHVHLLLQGSAAESNLAAFLRSFKQSTAQKYLAKTGHRLWQKRFYDYILRPRDSADSVAWYIWLNPVRKGLCVLPEEYPFSGSFTLPWPRSSPSDLKWSPPWKKPCPPSVPNTM
jgi:putative transposase